MSDTAESVSETVERLGRHDLSLKQIYLSRQQHTDAALAELVDCLLAHPDVATHVYLDSNQLTDETGVKLARYIAASSTIQSLSLRNNLFGEATYLAVAAALRRNSSLRSLYLDNNQATDQAQIDAAFTDALRLNPGRPAGSVWWLSPFGHDDFERMKDEAEQGHPSLRLLLALLC